MKIKLNKKENVLELDTSNLSKDRGEEAILSNDEELMYSIANIWFEWAKKLYLETQSLAYFYAARHYQNVEFTFLELQKIFEQDPKKAETIGLKTSDPLSLGVNNVKDLFLGYKKFLDIYETLINNYFKDLHEIATSEKPVKDLSDTIALMSSDSYKDRFKAEYHQLKIRYEKLKSFNNKIEAAERVKYSHISSKVEEPKHDCPSELLREQQHLMGDYLHILELRAVLENVNL